MGKDSNNLKGFNEWLEKTFTWVAPELKRYLRRAWCARGKYDRKNK